MKHTKHKDKKYPECGADESQSQQHSNKRKSKLTEEVMLATTCFYCGDPAIPATHGFDPRCERHYDV